MKYLFLILFFISSNLLALTKVYTPSDTRVSTTRQSTYRGDLSGCNSQADTIDGYASAHSDNTNNSYWGNLCVNPDSSKLHLKHLYITDTYSASPRCTVFYANDSDRDNGIASYNLFFVDTQTASCVYECKSDLRSTPPDDSPDWTWSEEECRWVKPCTRPKDYPVGMYNTSDECNDAVTSLSSSLKLAGGLYCFSCSWDDQVTLYQRPKNCPSGFILKNGLSGNENLNYCVKPACEPLSSQSVNIPKSSCVNGAHFNNFDKGYSGVLAWQECDSTCYVLEIQPIPCTDLVLNHQTHSNCDIDLNIDTYKCVNSSTNGLPTISSSCTPKNEKPTVSPCTKLKKTMQDGCFRENKILVGDCQDNGIMVTSSNLKCEEKIPNCNDFHQHLDTATNTCKCDTGYSLDTFGTCNKPFAWDDNSTDNNTSSSNQNNNNQNNENQSRNHADNKKTNDLLQSNSDGINDLKNSLSNTNNTLAGIRSDLNTSNGLLNKISDKLNSSFNFDDHSSDNSKILDIFDNTKKSIDNIKSDYDMLISKISGGFSIAPASSGVSPSFSGVVYGKTITIDFCPFLQKLYPIGFWLFSLIFVYSSIRIFIFSFFIKV